MDDKLGDGQFHLTPPLERLKEVEMFLEKLDLKNCYLASDHVTNYLWAGPNIIYRGVDGSLPEDKPKMLQKVRQAITAIPSLPYPVMDSNELYRKGLIYGL